MNVHATSLIRPARATDAACLAELINIAGEGIPEWLWTRSCADGQSPLEVGAARAERSSGGFSYTNALVAEYAGQPVGMVLSYAITEAPNEDPNELPAPIAPFVALEKRSVGTWYINALAIYPDHRGRGIGSRLMRTAEEAALARNFPVMSIQVYGQNSGAVRLYDRLGYERVAQEPVRLHPAPPYYTGDVLLLKKKL